MDGYRLKLKYSRIIIRGISQNHNKISHEVSREVCEHDRVDGPGKR